MDSNLQLAVSAFLFIASLVGGLYALRRLWLPGARLRAAYAMVERDRHNKIAAGRWPALLLLVRLLEEEAARANDRSVRADLIRLLDDEEGGELPQAARVAIAAAALDDFSGGPSNVTGPHRKVPTR